MNNDHEKKAAFPYQVKTKSLNHVPVQTNPSVPD